MTGYMGGGNFGFSGMAIPVFTSGICSLDSMGGGGGTGYFDYSNAGVYEGVEVTPDVRVRFDPKENITAFELCELLEINIPGFDKDTWAAMSNRIKRHFTVIEEENKKFNLRKE